MEYCNLIVIKLSLSVLCNTSNYVGSYIQEVVLTSVHMCDYLT